MELKSKEKGERAGRQNKWRSHGFDADEENVIVYKTEKKK